MQKALDRVSQNRTTIVIAHRLSTIRKADNIIVMRDGRKIEEGTHDVLLSNPDGVYSGLVHAQQLEAESAPAISEEQGDGFNELEREMTHKSDYGPRGETKARKNRGFLRSVGQLLFEQRRYWVFFLVILTAAMGTGCKSTLSRR